MLMYEAGRTNLEDLLEYSAISDTEMEEVSEGVPTGR